MKILVIEDNVTIAKQLVEFLSSHAWSVDHAFKGKQGLALAQEHIYDVVILDLGLPDMDGLEVCRTLKQETALQPGILMLTARDAFEDKAEGFHLGTDDYLTKPFDLREVALRCKALGRRNDLHQPKEIIAGELRINIANKTAYRQDKELKLTSTGFLILKTLMQAHPHPVSRREILHRIWGDAPPESDALKSHVYSLRSTVDKPFPTSLIKTVLNIGFKLDIPDDEH